MILQDKEPISIIGRDNKAPSSIRNIVKSGSQCSAVSSVITPIVKTVSKSQSEVISLIGDNQRMPLPVDFDGGHANSTYNPDMSWDGGGADGIHTPLP